MVLLQCLFKYLYRNLNLIFLSQKISYCVEIKARYKRKNQLGEIVMTYLNNCKTNPVFSIFKPYLFLWNNNPGCRKRIWGFYFDCIPAFSVWNTRGPSRFWTVYPGPLPGGGFYKMEIFRFCPRQPGYTTAPGSLSSR